MKITTAQRIAKEAIPRLLQRVADNPAAPDAPADLALCDALRVFAEHIEEITQQAKQIANLLQNVEPHRKAHR